MQKERKVNVNEISCAYSNRGSVEKIVEQWYSTKMCTTVSIIVYRGRYLKAYATVPQQTEFITFSYTRSVAFDK